MRLLLLSEVFLYIMCYLVVIRGVLVYYVLSCGYLEVVADEMPSLTVVLKADKKREALLEEEKILVKEIEDGNTTNTEKLNKVRRIIS